MATDRLTMCLSLERLAASQFGNFDFNSMCRFGDRYLGANEDGIFVLNEADKDGDPDDPTDIEAFFRTPLTDFGVINQKRIRSLYIGYETDGDLEVRLGTEERSDRVLEVLPRYSRREKYLMSGTREHSIKVPVGRDGKGRYWDIEIRNRDGADFSVDEITVIPMVLGAKPEDA